jgi:hypothetical protein
MRKGKDPPLTMDPDLGGPKPCGSGSPTLPQHKCSGLFWPKTGSFPVARASQGPKIFAGSEPSPVVIKTPKIVSFYQLIFAQTTSKCASKNVYDHLLFETVFQIRNSFWLFISLSVKYRICHSAQETLSVL